MSPRAAWRLESLGFSEVYDYVAGKADWLAFGLPRAGTAAGDPTVGDAASRDGPTALPNERLSDVRARLAETGWDTCIVVNEQRVVLGRLGRRALGGSSDGFAEEAMTEGPSTIRPSKRLDEELRRMGEKGLTSVVVTTPDGRLFGVLVRRHAERLT